MSSEENYKQRFNEFISSKKNEGTNTDDFIQLVKQFYRVNTRSYITDNFFLKSHHCFLLPYENYTSNKGGVLSGFQTSPTKFDIVNVTDNSDTTCREKTLFVKILDISTQSRESVYDLCIFDILSSLIFEYLIQNDQIFRSNYSNFIPKYKNSCLTYVKRLNEKTIGWDLNEIRNNLSKSNSLELLKSDQKSVLLIYEAITNSVSVFSAFYNSYLNKEIIIINEILNCVPNFYNFLKYIGLKYGYMHNDLHTDNIIYNKSTKTLMLIDFGRNSFAYFKHNHIQEIRNKINNEFKKLNYNELYSIEGLISVEELYMKTQPRLFKGFISPLITLSPDNKKFIGVIYDLITFSLNMYLRELQYLESMESIHSPADNGFYYEKKKNLISLFDELLKLTPKVSSKTPYFSSSNYFFDINTNFTNFNNIVLKYDKIYNTLTSLPDINDNERQRYMIYLHGITHLAYLYCYCLNSFSGFDLSTQENRLHFISKEIIAGDFQIKFRDLVNFATYLIHNIYSHDNSGLLYIIQKDLILSEFIKSQRGGNKNPLNTSIGQKEICQKQLSKEDINTEIDEQIQIQERNIERQKEKIITEHITDNDIIDISSIYNKTTGGLFNKKKLLKKYK
jgi:hypothetical protein